MTGVGATCSSQKAVRKHCLLAGGSFTFHGFFFVGFSDVRVLGFCCKQRSANAIVVIARSNLSLKLAA